MKLNDRTVTATKPALPPNKSEAIIFCEDTPGFGIRLRPGGSRSWIFQYDIAGRTRRVTLGKFPKVSARQAREAIETLASKLGLGIDPAQEKFDRRTHGDTFEIIQNL